jgi:hypothetical protein
MASALVLVAQRLATARPVVRFIAWAFAVCVLSAGLLAAVVTQSFVRYREPSANASVAYDIYEVVCFALPALLYLWLLHRGGFSHFWQQESNTTQKHTHRT